MSIAASLRVLGILAVMGALLDPGCARPRRPVVEVAFAGAAPESARSQELTRITTAAPWATVVDARLPGGVDMDSAHARIVVGQPADVLDQLQRRGATLAWEWTPPALVLASVRAPARVVAGLRTDIVVGVEGVPVGDGLLRVVVTDAASGLEQARAEASRKAVGPRGGVDVSVPWLATRAGVTRLRVRASLGEGGSVQPSPPGDVSVDVRPARVEVAVLEARPTWAARFARLALADQAGIDVRTEVRVAPAIAVRTTPAAPDGHPGVILVGGVEALTASDVSRLELGVRERGQAVVLVLDEVPGAGPWRRLWPEAVGTLHTAPAPVVGRVGGHVWKMREWLAGPVSTGVTPLASLQGGAAAFVIGRALGAGRVVLVSALDAWRWRGDADVAFVAGWRTLVQRLGVDVPPAVAATAWAGGEGRRRVVQVDVALRPDLARRRGLVVVADRGAAAAPVSLRQVEAGRWRGSFRPVSGSPERLVVRAREDQGPLAEARAVIDVSPPLLVASWADVVRHQAWRGRLSTGSAPLPDVMAALQRGVPTPHPQRWYLTRTWWFAGLMLAALGVEWILRRLAGDR